MKYYVMYEDDSDCDEMTLISLTTDEEVATFIEDKINKHAYGLEDFKVVQGTELTLRTVLVPFTVLINKVLLMTN